MTLTAAILINVALDLAIIAGLAFALTRAARLTPHGEHTTQQPRRAPRPVRRSLSARRRLAATAR